MAYPNPPILVSPPNESIVIGNVIVFVFTVPSDADNNTLVFRVELDITNPPNAAHTHYKVNESRFANDLKTNGNWQVQDSGSNFIHMPTGGIGSEYYGRDARVFIRKQDTVNYPDIDGAWYWRISAGDGMGHPVLFNRAIFAQAVFGVT